MGKYSNPASSTTSLSNPLQGTRVEPSAQRSSSGTRNSKENESRKWSTYSSAMNMQTPKSKHSSKSKTSHTTFFQIQNLSNAWREFSQTKPLTPALLPPPALSPSVAPPQGPPHPQRP